MEEQLKEKKIRWNISKAMSSVYQSLNGSKLKIKKTKTYSAAMENLKALYNLNQTQVWILCLACERYFECEDSISLKNISGERPALSDIHDMCKCEKIDTPDGLRRMGFCL